MKYQITDAKTRYFNDKQHYLNFLDAWKKAASADDCQLTASQMLFYALVRGKDVRTAFTPITKETKLRNGHLINHGMYEAYESLRRANENFLAPFDGTIDEEVLLKLIDEMPTISPIYSNYGKGIAIAETLIETDERDAKTLWNIIEEAS